MVSSDLQKVAQLLRQIKSEAQQAQSNIALMRKELEGMIAASARGGTPTAAGVRGATDRVLLGAGKTGDPRVRAGGGSRANVQAIGTEIQQIIDEITQSTIDLNIQELRATALMGATRPADFRNRLQLILAELDRILTDRLRGYQSVIYTGGFERLPPGGLTALSRAGEFPQLPAGQPAYGAPPPGTPRLTAGDIRYTPQPTRPIIGEPGEIIEATFVDETKLLESGIKKAAIGFEHLGQTSEEIGAKLKEDADQLFPPPSGADDLLDDKAAPEPAALHIREQFKKIYPTFGAERLEAVETKAKKIGFDREDVKTVETYADAYTRVNYAVKDHNDIMRKASITVDKAGNTLVSTQKQFRTFASAIRRNIGEMIKWSAAVLLIWGSIRKMSELLELAIANETQLANVAVVLGKAQADLNQVFSDAADAAYATGESISGVIEGYVAAYRATGNIENQLERTRVAQVLLTDSLTLSKLSSLSQTEALDTLVGALRQMGMGLDEGVKLMDKWVKVSRYAQVSIETLAESFAITATSASNAGVDIDYLNGLIATIAEVTTLSASESGNAIRAFISSFKSESAVKELGQYGIAVLTLEGETRGFLDIMEEIASLFERGIISESQLNKIGRAIGGRGARREAQVVAVIKNLTRAQELAAIGADAEGEAQAALGIQLDVVQTALTRLSNSFQVLARTMGADGGVLDITGQVLTLFTQVIDTTSAITKNLGELTPVVVALGLAMAITSQQTRAYYALEGTIAASRMLGGISTRLASGFERAALAEGIGSGAKFAGGAAMQVGAAGLTAYTAVKAFQDEDFASAGGAIGGAIIGTVIAGGNPIGTVIGMAAGKALASAVLNYEPEFENFFKKTIGGGIEDVDAEKVADPIQLAMEEAFKSTTVFGGETEIGGRAISNVVAWVKNQMAGVEQFFGAEAEFITPEEQALEFADVSGRGEEVRRLLKEAKEFQQAQAGVEAEGFDFEFINRQEAFLAEYGDYLDQLEETQSKATRTRALEGKITDRELRTSLEVIPKLQASISTYAVGFGDEFKRLNPQLKTATQSMDAFARIIIGSSPEQLQYLSSLNNEVARLTNLLELAKEAGEDFIIFKPEDETTDEIDEIRWGIEQTNEGIIEATQNAALFGTMLYRAAQASFIELPSVTTLDIKEEDLDRVLAESRRRQRELIKATFAADLNKGISIEEIEATFDPIMIQAGESGGYIYAEGFMSGFLPKVVADMQAVGEIIAPAPTALQIRPLDISSGQLPGVLADYERRKADLREQARVGGFELAITEETFAALLNDFVAVPITADLTLLNLGMSELIDVNKKQLEGVYNLPTDASFYVPFQGYELGLGDEGGLGGAAGALTGAADDLKDAARSLEVGEDWGGSLEEFLGIRKPGPTDFELKYPRYELPEMLGPLSQPFQPFTTDIMSSLYGQIPPEPTIIENFLGALENADQRVDQFLSGIGISTPGVIRPETQDPETPFWQRLLDLFNQLIPGGGLGVSPFGVGFGAGIGPTFDFSRLDNAASSLENLASVPPGQLPLGAPLTTGFTEFGADFGSVIELLSQKISNLSGFTTNLKISSTTTTNLIVDGRTLAEIVKPYLYSDQIRFEDSATSVTKNVVV